MPWCFRGDRAEGGDNSPQKIRPDPLPFGTSRGVALKSSGFLAGSGDPPGGFLVLLVIPCYRRQFMCLGLLLHVAIQPLLEQDGSLSVSTWPADTRAPTWKFRLPSIWHCLQRELLCMDFRTHALNTPSVSMELLKLTACSGWARTFQ